MSSVDAVDLIHREGAVRTRTVLKVLFALEVPARLKTAGARPVRVRTHSTLRIPRLCALPAASAALLLFACAIFCAMKSKTASVRESHALQRIMCPLLQKFMCLPSIHTTSGFIYFVMVLLDWVKIIIRTSYR